MSTEHTARDVEYDLDLDVEAAVNPAEADGTFRDSRECAALAIIGGGGALLLAPPTPRPKKG
ncbi:MULTISPECIES: hypothetical protein [Streptomyces]|uniref:Uncharacterized protein n=1 Tax=Streptomyces cacaoi TaxID=1898 RepID=A0A4Y3R7V0_STRCI|nr:MULTISPECIES: hypothetical protein [Streptomyces]NNG89217.1 hypothetical protein [Streptomyces cacaoi]QHF93252.1 hypothetical protein DEH18_04350 [Streptomyces sp. NHF165]GEB53816.1 hypothetical protein SCA03_63670 [Streptomyces cacaoi]